MNKKEREVLRTERIHQMLIAMSQKAGICNAVVKAYGDGAKSVIEKEIKRDIAAWVEAVKKDQSKENIKSDIEGMHQFFWGPNEDEKMVYTYEDQGNSRSYCVTECPLSAHARKEHIEEWAGMFFCNNYQLIANTYNENMDLKFEKRMMDGDECCQFTFTLKTS